MNDLTEFRDRIAEVGDGFLVQLLYLIVFVSVYLMLCVACKHVFDLRNLFEAAIAGMFAFIALAFAAGVLSLVLQCVRFFKSLRKKPITLDDEPADMCIVPLPAVRAVRVADSKTTNVVAFPGRAGRPHAIEQTIEED